MAEEGNSQKGNPGAHHSEGRRVKGLCKKEVKELGVKSGPLCTPCSGQQAATGLALLQPCWRPVQPAP